MYDVRPPYGRQTKTGAGLERGDGNGKGPVPVPDGQTYYGMPVIKPSYYSWLVVAYLFIGGLASAAQFIATVVDLFGGKRDRPIVRAGRYLALGGALVSPFLLIGDLHTPQRWYNMLRIFRRTSPMSIGSWALFSFGMFSGVVAVGQAIEDLLGWALGGWLARLFSLPAAFTGGIVSLYTGTLLAATSIPLWASAWPFLSSLFASSSASTATAALTLAANAADAPESTRQRLGRFALITSAAELFFAMLIERNWRQKRTAAPLRKPPLASAWRAGVLGLGILTPLLVHANQAARGEESRRMSALAALATLMGGVILRAVFVFGGNESARRPEDYFRFTQPEVRAKLDGKENEPVPAQVERGGR